MKKLRMIFVSLLLMSAMFSCANKTTDSDKVADAQACIDRSPAAEAESCLSKIEGVETKGAYLIRCVANFNREGFTTPARMASLMDAITNTAGANETIGVMVALAFKGDTVPANNVNRIKEASANCTKAENKILTMFTSLGMLGTLCTDGDPAVTISSLTTSLATCMSTSSTVGAAVGTALLDAYAKNCTNGSTSGGETCAQLATVINTSGGSPAAVADALSKCLNDPTSCTGF